MFAEVCHSFFADENVLAITVVTGKIAFFSWKVVLCNSIIVFLASVIVAVEMMKKKEKKE